jgi:ribosomal protein S18 acetylase RimI-like enzyme
MITRHGFLGQPVDNLSVVIRRFDAGDSIQELTEILHRAYAKFSEIGIQMKAANQPASETRKRIVRGECLVAEMDGRLVGTLVWRQPGRPQSPCSYYRRPDVATFEQFGVEPDDQGRGIGLKLLREAESKARRSGAAEMACDAAAKAQGLVHWYQRHGYRIVSKIRWQDTNHENLVLSKRLGRQQASAAIARHD